MMDRKIYARAPDGTLNPEWVQARRGKLTASEIHRIMGEEGKRETYLLEKLAEWVTGCINSKGLTEPMEQGILQESEAAAAYTKETGEPLVQGYLFDGPGFLATPDYLLVSGGVLEIKRPIAKTALGEQFGHLLRTKPKRKRIDGKLVEVEPNEQPPDEYYWQCIAQAVATGEPWTDLYYYCPELEPVGLQTWARRVYLESYAEHELLNAVKDANALLDRAIDAVTTSRSEEVLERVLPQIEAAKTHEEVDEALYSVGMMRLPKSTVALLDKKARERTMEIANVTEA